MRSHLLEGVVRHRRARPFVYALEHRVFYVALDLDELDEVARSIRLIGRNRWNLLSFRDGDHLDPPATDLRRAVRDHLRAEGVDPEGWRTTLITNLRVFGYVFNPASFYLCRDEAGTLQVVVVEVHNTHGERHLYTLRQPPAEPAAGAPVSAGPELAGPVAGRAEFVASMAKDFYVSPFIEMAGTYTVRVHDEPTRLRISINEDQDGALLLHTSIDLTRRRLTDRGVARMLVRYPFVTHRTIGLIHWHALRLWRRGAAFHRHGAISP